MLKSACAEALDFVSNMHFSPQHAGLPLEKPGDVTILEPLLVFHHPILSTQNFSKLFKIWLQTKQSMKIFNREKK